MGGLVEQVMGEVAEGDLWKTKTAYGQKVTAAFWEVTAIMQAGKFLNWCVDRDLIEASPAAGVKPPSAETDRDRQLEDVELRLVLRNLGPHASCPLAANDLAHLPRRQMQVQPG